MTQHGLFGANQQVNDEEQRDIPWSQYVRMVQLFFNQEQFEKFNEAMNKLKPRYGTKNPTDTVLEAVKRLTSKHVFTAADQMCVDCDGTNNDLCSNPDGCPKRRQ